MILESGDARSVVCDRLPHHVLLAAERRLGERRPVSCGAKLLLEMAHRAGLPEQLPAQLLADIQIFGRSRRELRINNKCARRCQNSESHCPACALSACSSTSLRSDITASWLVR